ncbi:MAG: membrane protein insertion efficiency factor YidD [Ruminococcaceae bacterium]|nr:membrane protein insertion efficiency factor YidD [Oscillospiraceae bacterium]
MRRWCIAAVRWYQRRISAHTKPCCRFTPTCSQYAVEAFARFGTLRGGLLALWRILRCNPWGGKGYDPVPKKFTFRRQKTAVYMDDAEAESLYDADSDM